MRKLLYVLILASVGGCWTATKTNPRKTDDGHTVVVIDSCEYIEVSYARGAQWGYYSLTHKGNCSFCMKRKMQPPRGEGDR